MRVELADLSLNEGGNFIPVKSPGRATYPNVTLSRGATDDVDMYQWFQETFDAAIGEGELDPNFKRTFDLIQLKRNKTEARRWTIFGAYPRSFEAGTWDGEADEFLMETVELVIDYWVPRIG